MCICLLSALLPLIWSVLSTNCSIMIMIKLTRSDGCCENWRGFTTDWIPTQFPHIHHPLCPSVPPSWSSGGSPVGPSLSSSLQFGKTTMSHCHRCLLILAIALAHLDEWLYVSSCCINQPLSLQDTHSGLPPLPPVAFYRDCVHVQLLI